ncbi:MAG: hypothetical protein Q9N68_02960 [Gammaproteobacteria bacterium]|nr:hypothetical protein [Gammaproteobacteria bacterium]
MGCKIKRAEWVWISVMILALLVLVLFLQLRPSAYLSYELFVVDRGQQHEAGKLEIAEPDFGRFMLDRVVGQELFLLSLNLPWVLPTDKPLTLAVVTREAFYENGQRQAVLLPTEQSLFDMGSVTQFEQGAARFSVDRAQGRYRYMGFFQLQDEQCSSFQSCVYQLKMVQPDMGRAAESFRLLRP